jgi:TPR repeat protein
VTKDEAKGAEWYTRSAEAGEDTALRHLGVRQWHGQLCPLSAGRHSRLVGTLAGSTLIHLKVQGRRAFGLEKLNMLS